MEEMKLPEPAGQTSEDATPEQTQAVTSTYTGETVYLFKQAKPPYKWYNNPRFPLIPVITYRKADDNNTFNFSFVWLFISIWSLDSFQFELALNAETHFGIGITAILPYLRFVFCFPLPMCWIRWVHNHLDRKPKNGWQW